MGVNVSFDDDGVTLTVGDHDETYEAQGEFDFPDGPRKYILDTFPEAIKFQEQQ